MKQHKHRFLGKLLALGLAITLILMPAASALTADQFKQLLQEYYLDGVSDAILQEETIEGILTVLNDPYTEYMTKQEYQKLLNSLNDQEFGGLGISVQDAEQGLLIVEVFADTPAAKLGLKSGDIITAVEGNSASGKSSDLVTSWLRGEPGSNVKLQVLHGDGQVKDYSAVRQKVVVPATSTDLIDGHIGYINSKTFGDQTLSHFLSAMKQDKQVDSWMVDLRTNLGGDVEAATQSLGVFLGKTKIVFLKDGKDQYLLYESEQNASTNKPTIVLTSGWTASSAEIFSAVMRDAQAALLVGEKTFGKGVAQTLLNKTTHPNYFTEGDAAKITAFRYFTCQSGNTADQIGVIPHLLVDAYNAGDIALLLSATPPSAQDKSGYLRLELANWTGYINLSDATNAANKDYFTELLEALPPSAVLTLGNSMGNWIAVTPSALVKQYGLKDYDARVFQDLTGKPYADDINTLATYQIVQGDQNGNFRPDASMTRAELCALLVQALRLPAATAPKQYSDVSSSAWYADEVQAVVAAGLMDGMGNSRFSPEETLKEEQLITVLARVSTRLNTYLYETSKEWNAAKSTAVKHYSTWSQQWVWLLSESQQDLNGQPINLLFKEADKIDPQKTATRAEAGELLYHILNYTNIIPA